MNPINFDRNIVSNILDNVCKLEVGRKFTGLSAVEMRHAVWQLCVIGLGHIPL